MAKLNVGDKAPDFSLPTNGAKDISLKDYRKKKNVVLYFYPKDDTPGCTIEACGFRDRLKDISQWDTVILGVSPDDTAEHEKFTSKYQLPFPLLSDADKKICQAYGVWMEKNMYGRKYMGVARTTYIINKEGRIAKIFEKVKPQGHNEEVLEFVRGLKGST